VKKNTKRGESVEDASASGGGGRAALGGPVSEDLTYKDILKCSSKSVGKRWGKLRHPKRKKACKWPCLVLRKSHCTGYMKTEKTENSPARTNMDSRLQG